MPYPTLYFGVELEFSVAWLYPNEPLVDPTEKRPSNFPPSQESMDMLAKRYNKTPWTYDDLCSNKGAITEFFRRRAMRNSIHQAIRNVLASAGFPIVTNNLYPEAGDTSVWNLEDDATIVDPTNSKYRYWSGVELISPAYEFTPENLLTVEKVCKIITTTSLTDTNSSTGLHVHVSFGADKKWSFYSIRHVLMFFWSFQTQFDTLHPSNRQDTTFIRSMRTASKMSTDHFTMIGKQLTPLEGLLKLDTYDNMEKLLQDVSGDGDPPSRYMAYNVKPILDTLDANLSLRHPKMTPEFRQHAGTLEGERVTQWIKLICNVIEFLEKVQPASLMELLYLVVEKEEWCKTGIKEHDDRTEHKFGRPVLAEDRFMITDLLEHIGLQESADFYRSRLYEVKPFRDEN